MENQEHRDKDNKERDKYLTDTNDGFLVSEQTEDVDASGVDDRSTGMGDDDYLGKTNTRDKE